MSRIISVWLPAWPIERLARADIQARQQGRPRPSTPTAARDERPLALVETGPHGLRLTALCSNARHIGLRSGLALADARAAVPDLHTRPAEPGKDRVALLRLVRWAGRYGPARNSDDADGFWIDVTGVAHLFGGEAAMITDIDRRLGAFGVTARAAIADTYGAAYALARDNRRREAGAVIAEPGNTAEAVRYLPVEGLRLEAETVVVLKRLGLRRIGDLYALPREAIERRFREDGKKTKRTRKTTPSTQGGRDLVGSLLKRLDQALGRVGEPRAPLVEPPVHIVRALFAEPLISGDGIASSIAALAAELCDTLDRNCGGARRLRLALYRSDGTCATLSAGTSAPCRDPVHIDRLFADRLANIDAGFGIDTITLEALRVDRLDPAQSTLAARFDRASRMAPAILIDRLVGRLGSDRVLRLERSGSHIPEKAERRVPISDAEAIMLAPATRQAAAGPRMPPRPPLLLPSPEPISVIAEVPEGPPARFTWRRVAYRVAKAEGPERIAGEWWLALPGALGADRSRRQHHASIGGEHQSLGQAVRAGADQVATKIGHALEIEYEEESSQKQVSRRRPRDYYRLEDDRGARFWVFREGLYQREAEEGVPYWYVHGLYG